MENRGFYHTAERLYPALKSEPTSELHIKELRRHSRYLLACTLICSCFQVRFYPLYTFKDVLARCIKNSIQKTS